MNFIFIIKLAIKIKIYFLIGNRTFLSHFGEPLPLPSNASWTCSFSSASHCIFLYSSLLSSPFCSHIRQCRTQLSLYLAHWKLILLLPLKVRQLLWGTEDVCFSILPLLPQFCLPSHGMSTTKDQQITLPKPYSKSVWDSSNLPFSCFC